MDTRQGEQHPGKEPGVHRVAGRLPRPFGPPQAWIYYTGTTDSVQLGVSIPRWWFVIQRFPRLRLLGMFLGLLRKAPGVARDGHAAHKRDIYANTPWRPPGSLYGRGRPGQ